MSKYIVDSSLMTGIADNIRLKTGEEGNLVFPTGFNAAIESLPSIEDMRDIKDKVDDIKDIFDSNESEIDKTITTPVDIASFNNGADDIPMALKVAVEPVQDLHGYESPWPEGGGKNLFNISELWSNGTNYNAGNGQTLRYINIPVASGTTVTASTNVINNTSASVASVFVSGQTSAVNSSGNGVFINQPRSITAGAEGVYIWIRTESTDQLAWNETTFAPYYIQLEIGSSATAWSPYANICPISGWTGANVARTGVNLSPESEVKLGGSNPRTYSYFTGSNLPAGTYTISFTKTGTAPSIDNTGTIQVVYMDGDYKTVGRTSPSTFTADKDIRRIYYYMSTSDYNNGYEITFSNIQLESGSTASAFEPYRGNTYQITFPSSAGTVYGGELTINKDGSGTLVVDHAFLTDDGSINWIQNADGSFYVVNPGSPAVQNAEGCACNYAPFAVGFDGLKVFFRGNGLISLAKGWANSYATVNDLKAAFASVPIQFVYELATPVTYELTELEVIETLKGINNIWSDTGKINEVEYSADSQLCITNKLNELDSLLSTYTETQA